MRALVYSAWDTLEMADVPVPDPGPGEVRLRVEAAGICGSELEAVRKRSPRRPPPLILGHEFTGVVDAVGPDVQMWTVGQPVVANAVMADATCPACRRGQTHLCANRRLFGMHRPGGFAEFVTAPETCLIARPAEVKPSHASMTEPLANGVHVAGLLAEAKPKTVVVFGAGPIGLLVMQALRHRLCARVATVDRDSSRLKVAQSLGAEAIFRPDEMEDTLAWAGEDGPEAAVDAVGAAATKAASLRLIRPGGTAVWIGLHENESPLNAYDLILPEKRVLGSYACTQGELATALEWIADGSVDVSSWVTPSPLDQADEAFARMLRPSAYEIKGILEMK